MKAYAGIGSRETPDEILGVMRNVAYDLATHGWTLRSGAARGADSAFEEGAFDAYFVHGRVPKPEIYLPWIGFEGRRPVTTKLSEPLDDAFPIAARFHPRWDSLKQGAQRLHARNVHQILGPDVSSPLLSRFVICWTKNGAGDGGTGQALRIARHYDIPVFDLAIANDYDRVTGGLFG